MAPVPCGLAAAVYRLLRTAIIISHRELVHKLGKTRPYHVSVASHILLEYSTSAVSSLLAARFCFNCCSCWGFALALFSFIGLRLRDANKFSAPPELRCYPKQC